MSAAELQLASCMDSVQTAISGIMISEARPTRFHHRSTSLRLRVYISENVYILFNQSLYEVMQLQFLSIFVRDIFVQK